MGLITEIIWKLITFLVVCLFVITLPFALLALVVIRTCRPKPRTDSIFSS
jgi:hypothetical protein